ncbi:MAG: hypothetical protein FWG47_04245 [Propionibacteriaceae bacterium]|nr:hypothetical protein [Propionibacteriaceae bacterium]
MSSTSQANSQQLLPDEPKRPMLAWVVLLLSFLAIGSLIASVLGAFWLAIDRFQQASWITNLIPTDYGSLWRIPLAAAITVLGLIPSISAAISGYYAFAGYRWARVATCITFILSGMGVLLNIIAFPAIALTALAAVFAWLPPMNRYYAAWYAIRHREPVFADSVNNVYYGPLPRYLPVPSSLPPAI